MISNEELEHLIENSMNSHWSCGYKALLEYRDLRELCERLIPTAIDCLSTGGFPVIGKGLGTILDFLKPPTPNAEEQLKKLKDAVDEATRKLQEAMK